MPIYEYACRSCGKTFEKIQRTAVDQFPCPTCGQPVERLVSRPATLVSGGGFTPTPGCGSGGFS